ncbi:MAG: sulfatase-like hydrolase/transferase, partial [SAR324 cluster bacterium]|nr:sulfatase-like hydrolase/transferase [SAR324 cluster bacterium]
MNALFPVYKKIVLFYFIALAQFTLARLALLLLYYGQFSMLSPFQIILAFIEGVRFDLASITIFCSVPFLLLALPVRIFRGRLWQGLWSWVTFVILLLMTGVLFGDIVYFDFVKRHTAHELLSFGEGDAGLMGQMIFTVFLPYLLVFLVNMAILIFVWKKVAGGPEERSRVKFRQYPAYIVFFMILVVVGRGGFGYKPLAIIDAFASGSSSYGNLVLNGVFSISQASLKAENVSHSFFKQADALKLIEKRIKVTNPDYPFQKQLEEKSTEPYNLVFILVESLSFKYVDSFSGKNLGVTPNIDRLANQGLKFTQFYANGQRSVEGIQATLTGIPSIIGLPTIGVGILANYSRLGELAEQNGYTTIFVESLK